MHSHYFIVVSPLRGIPFPPPQRVDVLSGTFFSQAFTALDVFLFRA